MRLLVAFDRYLDHVPHMAFADSALISPVQSEVEFGVVLDGFALTHLRLHFFVAEENGEVLLD